MKNQVKKKLLGLVIAGMFVLSTNAQNQIIDNVEIGHSAPAYGVKIKQNMPGYNGGWARAYSIANETGNTTFFGLGAYGSSVSGVPSFESGYIGRNYNDSFMNFLPNGNVGIGTYVPSTKFSVVGNPGVSTIASFYGGALSGNYISSSLVFGETLGVGKSASIGYMSHQNYSTSSGIFLVNYGDNESSASLFVRNGGNVGIGSINPDEKLTVKGKIHAEEIKVDLLVPADYVFEKYYTGVSSLKSDYIMPTLSDVENFTKKYMHLPNIPSASEIKTKGLLLGEMNNALLQKIEELTIYIIEQNKRIEVLEAKMNNK